MDDSTPLLLDSPLDCTSSRKLEQTYDEVLCSTGDNNRWVYVPCLLVVMAIVGVNYSVLVPDLNTGQSIAFHILLGLLIVSWIQSIITHPGPVPEGWSQRVKELHARSLALGRESVRCIALRLSNFEELRPARRWRQVARV